MLNIKDKGRIIQIKKHCERISDKMSGVNEETFNNDIDLREIVCFNIFQIGELAKGLSDEFIQEYDHVPWKQIKGMRDRIGHGYDTIDTDIVYNTAVESISELEKYCASIIDKTDNIGA